MIVGNMTGVSYFFKFIINKYQFNYIYFNILQTCTYYSYNKMKQQNIVEKLLYVWFIMWKCKIRNDNRNIISIALIE